jgi:hypothetical protein
VRDTRVSMERVGWSRAVLRPLLRALLLAGAAVVAYLAISLLDGPAQADSGSPAQPGHPSLLGTVVGGVSDAVSTVAGSPSTPDAAGGSGQPAAGTSGGGEQDSTDRSDQPGRAAAPSRTTARDEPAAAKPAGEAGSAKPSTKSGGGALAPVPDALAPAAAGSGVVPTLVGSATPVEKVAPSLAPVVRGVGARDVVGAVDAVARAATGDTLSAVTGAVLGPSVPRLVGMLLPSLTGLLSSLHQAVIAPVATTVCAVPAGVVATATGSSEQQAEGLLAARAAVDSRSPPAPEIPVSTGSAQQRAWVALPGLTGSTPVVPPPQAGSDGRAGPHPGGPGGSGAPPRRPAMPENAADGHLRVGAEGSPHRPGTAGRSAWEPELATGAVVTLAQLPREGRPAEADPPSG